MVGGSRDSTYLIDQKLSEISPPVPFAQYLHPLFILILLSLQLNEFNPMGDTLASLMGE